LRCVRVVVGEDDDWRIEGQERAAPRREVAIEPDVDGAKGVLEELYHLGGVGRADQPVGIIVGVAGHLAVLNHKVAALTLATIDGRATQHNHVPWPGHWTQQAGDGTAARQCDLKTARLVILGS